MNSEHLSATLLQRCHQIRNWQSRLHARLQRSMLFLGELAVEAQDFLTARFWCRTRLVQLCNAGSTASLLVATVQLLGSKRRHWRAMRFRGPMHRTLLQDSGGSCYVTLETMYHSMFNSIRNLINCWLWRVVLRVFSRSVYA